MKKIRVKFNVGVALFSLFWLRYDSFAAGAGEPDNCSGPTVGRAVELEHKKRVESFDLRRLDGAWGQSRFGPVSFTVEETPGTRAGFRIRINSSKTPLSTLPKPHIPLITQATSFAPPLVSLVCDYLPPFEFLDLKYKGSFSATTCFPTELRDEVTFANGQTISWRMRENCIETSTGQTLARYETRYQFQDNFYNYLPAPLNFMVEFGDIYPLPHQNRLLIALSSYNVLHNSFVWTQAPFVPHVGIDADTSKQLLINYRRSHIFELAKGDLKTEGDLKRLTRINDLPVESSQISFLGKLDTGEILLSYAGWNYREFAALNPETNQVSHIESSQQNFAIDEYEARSITMCTTRANCLPLGHPQGFFITYQDNIGKDLQIVFQTLLRENSDKKVFTFNNRENGKIYQFLGDNTVFPFIVKNKSGDSYLLLACHFGRDDLYSEDPLDFNFDVFIMQ